MIALGVASKDRSSALPDVPPIDQAVPGYEVSGWYGILTAAKTPKLVVAKLNAELNKALQQPDLPSRVGFETNVIRVGNRPEVDAHIAAVFAGLARDAAVARLRQAGTAYGFVRDVADFARHPALRRIAVATPGGPVSLPAPPVLADGAMPALGPVPSIGEHSAAIRAEFALPAH